MPPLGIAIRIDLTAAPLTKKPPPAEKLPLWDLKISRTMIVSTGTMIFQVVRTLFTRASQRTPTRLIAVNTNMRITATTMPLPVSLLAPEL